MSRRLLGALAPWTLLLWNISRVAGLTIDDAYISFRYARNLSRGLGLVYNAGERVEGYTNFLWTLLLAAGMWLGANPETVAKVMGSAAACGCVVLVFLLSERLKPGANPNLAGWLLASSMTFAAYSVLGLETVVFVFLLLLGVWLLDRGAWSGVAFGLAGLTRPEAPLFVGILLLCLEPRRLWRVGAVFAGIVGCHVLWRHWYYGTWIPNTFSAKTGDLAQQVNAGGWYVRVYLLDRLGGVAWLAVLGFVVACYERLWQAVAWGLIAGAWVVYVVLVGGDWMPCSRHMAVVEPFLFLLVDFGVRSLWGRPRRLLKYPTLAELGWEAA